MTEPTDLEYDLAHEDVPEPRVRDAPPATSVANATPSYPDGDYSYDLAHDVPGR